MLYLVRGEMCGAEREERKIGKTERTGAGERRRRAIRALDATVRFAPHLDDSGQSLAPRAGQLNSRRRRSRQTSTPPAPAPAPAKGVPRRVIHATAIHSRSLTEIDYIHGALIGVDETGVIAFLEREVASDEVREIVVKHGWSLDDGTTQLVSLGKGEFVIPGSVLARLTRAPSWLTAHS